MRLRCRYPEEGHTHLVPFPLFHFLSPNGPQSALPLAGQAHRGNDSEKGFAFLAIHSVA